MPPAIFPRWSLDQLTTPGLSDDGLLRGWVKCPSRLWTPDDDLLYQPADAIKSGDFDRVGSVVSFEPNLGLDELAWVEAQIRKADAYRERILALVNAGKMRLTAALRAFLGLDDDEERDHTLGILEQQRVGPLVAAKSADLQADLQRMIERTGGDVSEDRVRVIASAATARFAATGSVPDALDYILRAVRAKSVPVDPDTGLPDLGRA